MFKSRLARGAVVAAGAFVGVLLMGITSSANAAVIYSANNVSIKVTGGDAIAVNNCINDARDGLIQTQQNACYQAATAGNIVELDDSSIWVFASSCYCGLPLFSSSHVTVKVSGGLSDAINNCINDAQDGFIQTQQNACAQYATAGNILMLAGVSVVVESIQ
jgi:hypothetical protein